jgi:hypothetical protein
MNKVPQDKWTIVTMRTRKLYQIRHTPVGHALGRTVGHKAQLKPRAVAARIAARLRKAGIEARISPVSVNTTPAQDAYLARRYDAYTRRCLGLACSQ